MELNTAHTYMRITPVQYRAYSIHFNSGNEVHIIVLTQRKQMLTQYRIMRRLQLGQSCCYGNMAINSNYITSYQTGITFGHTEDLVVGSICRNQ